MFNTIDWFVMCCCALLNMTHYMYTVSILIVLAWHTSLYISDQISQQIRAEKPPVIKGEFILLLLHLLPLCALNMWFNAHPCVFMFNCWHFPFQNQSEPHMIQRGGSVCGTHTYRLIQSDCLQNRLPITQHFGRVSDTWLNWCHEAKHTGQKFGLDFVMFFERSTFCSPRLHLFN